MTRKDFELIAATLKAARGMTAEDTDVLLLNAVARDFADALRCTNKQFNRDKFLRACGVVT